LAEPPRILFVCLGNICRSPMAEGLFRHLSLARGGAGFTIDSAGTAGWHVGAPPDSRAQAALRERGIDISGHRARQVTRADFLRFDLLLAMDADNLRDLNALAPGGAQGKAYLFLDCALGHQGAEVPDPYYGGAGGFTRVVELVEHASRGLLERLGST